MNDEICVKSQWIHGPDVSIFHSLEFLSYWYSAPTLTSVFFFTSTEIEAPTPVCGNNGL